MNARQGLTAAVVLLLLLLLGVGYWAFKLNSEKKMLASENTTIGTEKSELASLKDILQREVDSLQQAYAVLADENSTLQGSVEKAQKRVAQKEAAINKIKSQGEAEASGLKTQIQELLALRSDLESSIKNLQSENDSLRIVTGQLTADLVTAKTENQGLDALNKTISEDLKRLTLANFKASGFQVEVEKKSSKATAKAGRARRLITSFDLVDVKEEYRGLRPIYLVITDDKGTPIKMTTPIQAKVVVNGQAMDIQAAQEKEINVVERQRLSFTYELEDKLKSGYYRVAVYTDIGLLGASSFRLG